MATELTQATIIKAASQTQEPQLVLQIDGVPTIYGVGTIKKYVRIGDPGLLIGNDWVIGGLIARDNQLDVIDISGSSNTISQQLLQDKGGVSSVPSIQISLIDFNGLITELITPGQVVEDILGRKANVYLGYNETSWPQDFIKIFSGVIDEITAGPTIILNVAHPEQRKRSSIFPAVTTKLTSALNFKSAKIQNITYRTRRDVVGTVTITYTPGATAGNEVVTVVGTAITIQIESGVTTASQIRNKIEQSLAAISLITLKIDEGATAQIQVTQGPTSLSSDTTINVVTTKGLLAPEPAQGFKTYVRIEDEVIEYTSFNDTQIMGLTREAFILTDDRAFGSYHAEGETVENFYRLQGNAVDLALKLLLSGGPAYFVENVKVKSINFVEADFVQNAIYFEEINIVDAYGLVVGDTIEIIGDQNPANNIVGLIESIDATPYGSYLFISGATMLNQASSLATASFGSKYNVLPENAGAGLSGIEVDVPEFERIKELYASSIFEYDFYVKEQKVVKDFIDTEILYPTGAFSIPKRGKVSIGYTSPPLGIGGLKVLDSTNTTKPDQTKIKRSITKYFYNNILFKFNEAVVDEKFLSGDLEVNETSKARIPVGNKPLVIEAKGLRPSVDTSVLIEILKKRFQDRYKFGAEVVSVSAFYGDTFDTDVGDVVVFGDPTLQLPDTKKGSRQFSPRLFEVANKSMSIKTGDVRLELVDSGYSLEDGRYGIISPSSYTVALGSTLTQIKIKNSFGLALPAIEKSKWKNVIGQKILVHNEDFSLMAETFLRGFSNSDNYVMLVDPALPWVVQDDFIVDIAHYPTSANPEEVGFETLKRIYVFTDPTVTVTGGASSTEFSVAIGDTPKFLPGAIILVRNEDGSIMSPEVHVDSVVGTTIFTVEDLTFTPTAGLEVDLIGFKDGGAPYRYL